MSFFLYSFNRSRYVFNSPSSISSIGFGCLGILKGLNIIYCFDWQPRADSNRRPIPLARQMLLPSELRGFRLYRVLGSASCGGGLDFVCSTPAWQSYVFSPCSAQVHFIPSLVCFSRASSPHPLLFLPGTAYPTFCSWTGATLTTSSRVEIPIRQCALYFRPLQRTAVCVDRQLFK